MKSLKDVKEALNKLPDELLDNFFITHKMWLEEEEAEMGLVFCCDEEEYEKHSELLEKDGMDVIIQFARDINTDAMKTACGKLDEELIEDKYSEDIPEKG